jgi:hypothetical protein
MLTKCMVLVICLLVPLLGCASIEPPAPGPGHPANPDAPSTPPMKPPAILQGNETDPPAASKEMGQGVIKDPHGHHGTKPSGEEGGSS